MLVDSDDSVEACKLGVRRSGRVKAESVSILPVEASCSSSRRVKKGDLADEVGPYARCVTGVGEAR